MSQKICCLSLLLILFLNSSCGKTNEQSVKPADGSPILIGDISIGTQCPYGTITPAVPRGFTVRNCALATPQLILQKPPGPLYFSGDCTEKVLAVRTQDGSVDTLWQIPPDGEFSLLLDGFYGEFASDSLGNSNCLSKMNLEIYGTMECQSRDAFTISVEKMRFWMSPPTEAELKISNATACALPDSCYLEASTKLQQCQ